jgi:YgiT-type zinc finger domain-containing protein
MIELKVCPTCGSRRIRRVTRTVTRISRGKRYVVPDLTFHECSNCGEQIYSPEAMEKIEARRPKLAKASA